VADRWYTPNMAAATMTASMRPNFDPSAVRRKPRKSSSSAAAGDAAYQRRSQKGDPGE